MLFDIHDRVNYAVTATRLRYGLEEKRITLYLTIDESICTMYEYFDIFLGRMTMCSQAARSPPRNAPYFSIASMAYCEQVGIYLQVDPPFIGERYL